MNITIVASTRSLSWVDSGDNLTRVHYCEDMKHVNEQSRQNLAERGLTLAVTKVNKVCRNH